MCVSCDMDRMALISSTFAMIRHIRLDYYLFGERKHQLLYPHSIPSSSKQSHRQTSLLLGSIRFISQHCHMLTSFQFVPNRALWHKPPRPKRKRILKTLTLALVELIQYCPSLRVVGFEIDFLEVYFSKSSSFAKFPPAEHYGGTNNYHNLNLVYVPLHAREVTVKQWCRTQLRYFPKDDIIVKFITFDELESLRGDTWRFEL
jgi:hypothetical protein